MDFQVRPVSQNAFLASTSLSTQARRATGVTKEKSFVTIIKVTGAERELILAVFTAKFCRAITKQSGLTDTEADPLTRLSDVGQSHHDFDC